MFRDKNGQKTEEINYDKGTNQGPHIKWYGDKNDQHKNFHINYKNGERNGNWHYWYSSGVDSLNQKFKIFFALSFILSLYYTK